MLVHLFGQYATPVAGGAWTEEDHRFRLSVWVVDDVGGSRMEGSVMKAGVGVAVSRQDERDCRAACLEPGGSDEP